MENISLKNDYLNRVQIDLNQNVENKYLQRKMAASAVRKKAPVQQQVFHLAQNVVREKCAVKRSESKSNLSDTEKEKRVKIEDHPLWNTFEIQHIPTKLSEDSKIQFIRIISSSLVSGALVKNKLLLERSGLMKYFDLCVAYDPEFIFKTLLYCRRELFIKSTSNFLLAKVAERPPCRSYLHKYFSALILLPSDWLDVVKTYHRESGKKIKSLSLPVALRKVLIEKFSEFDEYQLAKYNDVNSVKRQEKKRLMKLRQETASYSSSTKTSDGSLIKSSIEIEDDDSSQESKNLNLEELFNCSRAMEMDCFRGAEQSNAVCFNQEEMIPCQIECCDFNNFEMMAGSSLMKPGYCQIEEEEHPQLQEPMDCQVLQMPEPQIEKPRVAYEVLSMKKVLQYLHISKPNLYVMSLLGKRYPSNQTEFTKSGLEGYWDPSRAGERMRLKIPFTWETELSQKGNTKAVWENLIDSKKLPYMACLRNLRNICMAKVSEEHFNQVRELIINKKNIMNSKLFPMRFLTAFISLEMLMEKKKEIKHKIYMIQRKNKINKSKQDGIMSKHKKLISSRKRDIKTALEMVDEAFSYCIKHNLPPIYGRTLVIMTYSEMNFPWFKHLEPIQKSILTCMCLFACEYSDIIIEFNGHYQPFNVDLRDKPQLLSKLVHLMEDFNNDVNENILQTYLSDILQEKRIYDNIIVFGDVNDDIKRFVQNYRIKVGPLFAIANTASMASKIDDWLMITGHSDDVVRFLAEKGDAKLLQKIENLDKIYCKNYERKSTSSEVQISPEDTLNNTVLARPAISSLKNFTASPRSRQKILKIFISSTFKDMHGERDLLCGVVMPALRKKLSRNTATSMVEINETDLRWGVPETAAESPSSLQICLNAAANADIFVLLVGARYGWIPDESLVNCLDEKLRVKLKKFYKPGMSITDMEFNMAYQSISEKLREKFSIDEVEIEIRKRIMIFIRNFGSLETLPIEIKSHFIDKARELKMKQAQFMKRLRETGLVVLDKYPASYSRIINEACYMKNLNDLGDCLLDKLFESAEHLSYHWKNNKSVKFNNAVSMDTIPSSRSGFKLEDPLWFSMDVVGAGICQRYYNDLIKIIFTDIPARGLILKNQRFQMSKQAHENKPKGVDGCIVLVIGNPGCGKTTLASALAMRLSNPDWTTNFQREQVQIGNKFTTMRANEPELAIIKTSHQVYVHMTRGIISDNHNIIVFQKLFLVEMMTSFIAQLIKRVECMRPGYGIPLVGTFDKEIEDYENAMFNKISGLSQDSKLLIQIPFFHKILNYVSIYDARTYYSFIVDSVDSLFPKKLDWIPDVIPSNVNFFLFSNKTDNIVQIGKNRPDTLIYAMNHLTNSERASLVRTMLAQYGKLLNESNFKNQLAVISNKKDAGLPLYLRMACDELRLNSLYDDLDRNLKRLPQTLPSLVYWKFQQLSEQFGEQSLKATLAFILLARKPIHTSELSQMLNKWVQHQSNPDAKLPALAFYTLLSGIQSIVCGLEDETASQNLETGNIEDPSALNKAHQGLLWIRSPELNRLVKMYIFDELSDKQETIRTYTSSTKFSSTRKVAQKPLYSEEQRIFLRKIYSILSSVIQDSSSEIYYLTVSGNPGFACSRLCDFNYIIYRLSEIGNKKQSDADLINDFHGYIENLKQETYIPGDDLTWMVDKHSQVLRDLVLRNLNVLAKQPSLLIEMSYDQMPRNLGNFIPSDELSLNLVTRITSAINDIKQKSLKYQETVNQIIENNNSEILENITLDKQDIQKHFLRAYQNQQVCNIQPKMIFPLEGNIDQNATAIAISPFNMLVAYGTGKGSIMLADLRTGKTLDSFYGHNDEITQLRFMPLRLLPSIYVENQYPSNSANIEENLGLILCSVSKDGLANLWSLDSRLQTSTSLGSTGRLIKSLKGPHKGSMTCVDYHITRGYLALGNSDGILSIWQLTRETSSFRSIHKPVEIIFDASSFISAVAFRFGSHEYVNETYSGSDDLAIALWNGQCIIHNLETKERRILMPHQHAVCSLTYSNDPYRKLMATMSVNGDVIVFSAHNYVIQSRIDSKKSFISSLNLNPAVGTKGKVLFFSVPQVVNQENTTFTARQMLAFSGSNFGLQGKISLWDANMGKIIYRRIVTKPNKNEMMMTANCTDHTGKIRIFAKLDHTYVFQSSCDIGYSIKFKTLPTRPNFSKDSIVIKMHSTSFNIKNPIIMKFGNIIVPIIIVAVITDKNDLDVFELISPSEGNDEYEFRRILTEKIPGFPVCFVNLCDLSKSVLIGHTDGSMTNLQIDFINRKVLSKKNFYAQSSEITSISQLDYLIAIGSKDHSIAIYEIASESLVLKSVFTQAHPDWVTSLAFFRSTDGHNLISGGNESTIKIWKYMEGKINLVSNINGHLGPISWLKEIDSFILSLSLDGNLNIFRFNSDKLDGINKFNVDNGEQIEISLISQANYLKELEMTEDSLLIFQEVRLIKSDERYKCEKDLGKSPTDRKYASTISDVSVQIAVTTKPLEGDSKSYVLCMNPFLPKFENYLSGHQGVNACSISSALKDEKSSTLVSVAGPEQMDWRVFEYPSNFDQNIESSLGHLANVECINCLNLEESTGSRSRYIIVTGSLDGSLVFWEQQLDSTTDFDMNISSKTWQPICQIVQNEKITFGCVSSVDSVSLTNGKFQIIYAVGRKICLLKLRAKVALEIWKNIGKPIRIDQAIYLINDSSIATLEMIDHKSIITNLSVSTDDENINLLCFDTEGNITKMSLDKDNERKIKNLESFSVKSVNRGISSLYVVTTNKSMKVTYKEDINVENLDITSAKDILPCLLLKDTGDVDHFKFNSHLVSIIISDWICDEEDNFAHTITLVLSENKSENPSCKIYSKISCACYIGLADRIRIIDGCNVLCKSFMIAFATEPDGLIHILECFAPINQTSQRTIKVIGKPMKGHQPSSGQGSNMRNLKNYLWNRADWEQIGVFTSNNHVTTLSTVTEEKYDATNSIDLVVGTKTGQVLFYKLV